MQNNLFNQVVKELSKNKNKPIAGGKTCEI